MTKRWCIVCIEIMIHYHHYFLLIATVIKTLCTISRPD